VESVRRLTASTSAAWSDGSRTLRSTGLVAWRAVFVSASSSAAAGRPASSPALTRSSSPSRSVVPVPSRAMSRRAPPAGSRRRGPAALSRRASAEPSSHHHIECLDRDPDIDQLRARLRVSGGLADPEAQPVQSLDAGSDDGEADDGQRPLEILDNRAAGASSQ
jgi:hypothetical protein